MENKTSKPYEMHELTDKNKFFHTVSDITAINLRSDGLYIHTNKICYVLWETNMEMNIKITINTLVIEKPELV